MSAWPNARDRGDHVPTAMAVMTMCRGGHPDGHDHIFHDAMATVMAAAMAMMTVPVLCSCPNLAK